MPIPTVEEICLAEEALQKMEEALQKMKRTRDEYLTLPPEKQLAIWLHERLCRRDHEEQCSWNREYDNWEKGPSNLPNTHSYYLVAANKALKYYGDKTSEIPDEKVKRVKRAISTVLDIIEGL